MSDAYFAELRKQFGLSFARTMVTLLLLGGIAIVLAIAGVDLAGVMHVRSLLGWHSSIELWAQISQSMVFFMVPALAAWGLGLEQSHDTWKMVLTRRSPRRVIVLAKLLATFTWLGGFLLLSFVGWVGLGSMLGLLLPSSEPELPSTAISGLVQTLLQCIAVVPLISLITLSARSNGTLIGTLVGILGPMFVRMTEMWDWVNFNRLVPTFAAEALVLRLTGDSKRADAVVGASWGVSACLLVLVVWFVAPLVIAIWQFERRDIVSELA